MSEFTITRARRKKFHTFPEVFLLQLLLSWIGLHMYSFFCTSVGTSRGTSVLVGTYLFYLVVVCSMQICRYSQQEERRTKTRNKKSRFGRFLREVPPSLRPLTPYLVKKPHYLLTIHSLRELENTRKRHQSIKQLRRATFARGWRSRRTEHSRASPQSCHLWSGFPWLAKAGLARVERERGSFFALHVLL